MRITKISIETYKSLRNVSITPGKLTLLLGANASGKSNFSDCLDFISEIYRHGLEIAISRKGGYENIAYRRTKRSTKPIHINLCIELLPSDIPPFYSQQDGNSENLHFQIEHSFSFVARDSTIRANFEIIEENFQISLQKDGDWNKILTISRTKEGFDFDYDRDYDRKSEFVGTNERKAIRTRSIFAGFSDLEYLKRQRPNFSSTELLVSFIGRFIPLLYAFTTAIETIRVFQISPTKSREFGVPTPNPEIDRYGGNLPAVIDIMKNKNKKHWSSVMQAMRSVIPDLISIDVDYTTSKTLGLFFKEKGFGRPWSVDEVSDGTIQTLALLVAIYDPNSKVLVIEEPENSVHPWIIRQLIGACREASENKQIIITTHSPLVMNSVKPEDIWIIWRADGESYLSELSKIDPDFLSMWSEGSISTFDYLDSGALSEAIPPAPSESEAIPPLPPEKSGSRAYWRKIK